MIKILRQYTPNIYPLLIFICGIVLFTINLNPEFIAFQTRFALFAQEMLRHGISWFPTTYQTPYPDYPVLPTIFIYLVSLIFGKVTPFTAILPTAITAALILVFIYKIGALQDHLWGLYAVLFALFTQYFIQQSRSISLDQYTALATIISFYLAYSATIYQQNHRLWLVPLVLITGFACRGPIGLIMPTGVLCSYYLYLKEFKNLLRIILMAIALLAICFAVLSWFAYLQGGIHFVARVVTMEATGRLYTPNKNYLYYFSSSLLAYAVSFPIAILVTIVSLHRISKPKTTHDQLLGMLVCWTLIILIGMTIPAIKKVRYILPIVPAISLIAAYTFINTENNLILTWIKKIFICFCFCFPYLTIMLIGIAFIYTKHLHFNLTTHYLNASLFIIVLGIINWWVYKNIKYKPGKHLMIMCLAVFTFLTINIQIVSPIQYNMEKTKPFTNAFLTLYNQNPGKLVFYKIGPDAEDIKFMVNLNMPLKPKFTNSITELENPSKTTYYITKQKTYLELPTPIKQQFHLLYTGKIGHKLCVIFQLQK
jgi:hypothetical protein